MEDRHSGGETLPAVRHLRRQTQERLAAIMGTSQANISRLERRSDLRLSTLGEYLRALGGRLEVRAVFPDDEVQLTFPSLSSAHPNGRHEATISRRQLHDPQARAADLEFWLNHPAEERIAEVDRLRREFYGAPERLQRTARVAQRSPR